MASPATLPLPQVPPVGQLPPELRDILARFRFDLEDGRSFTLVLDHGRFHLEQGGGESDVTMLCSYEEFDQALNGSHNLLTAFMRGDIQVRGNLELAKRLYRYLRLVKRKEEHS